MNGGYLGDPRQKRDVELRGMKKVEMQSAFALVKVDLLEERKRFTSCPHISKRVVKEPLVREDDKLPRVICHGGKMF